MKRRQFVKGAAACLACAVFPVGEPVVFAKGLDIAASPHRSVDWTKSNANPLEDIRLAAERLTSMTGISADAIKVRFPDGSEFGIYNGDDNG